MFGPQGLNEGGFLILVACSKPYAISINFGVVPFSLPKQIPIGTLLLSYLVGTLILGKPLIAGAEVTLTPEGPKYGVTNASRLYSIQQRS